MPTTFPTDGYMPMSVEYVFDTGLPYTFRITLESNNDPEIFRAWNAAVEQGMARIAESFRQEYPSISSMTIYRTVSGRASTYAWTPPEATE